MHPLHWQMRKIAVNFLPHDRLHLSKRTVRLSHQGARGTRHTRDKFATTSSKNLQRCGSHAKTAVELVAFSRYRQLSPLDTTGSPERYTKTRRGTGGGRRDEAAADRPSSTLVPGVLDATITVVLSSHRSNSSVVISHRGYARSPPNESNLVPLCS